MEQRESKSKSVGRNAFGKEWQRTSSLRGLNVEVSKANERFIDCNEKMFAVPWKGGGGSLGILPIDKTGPLPKDAPLLQAHSIPLTTFHLSQIVPDLIATAARESTVKLWSVKDGDVAAHDGKPIAEINAHPKRVESLCFHPTSASIIASTGDDTKINLLNVEKATSAIQLEVGTKDRVTCTAWSSDGKLLCAGNRDKTLRVYDPRASTDPIASTPNAHESAKGFTVTFAPRHGIEGQPIVSIGFNSRSDRVAALWDSRSMEKPLCKTVVDHQPGWLTPFYDDGTGVLFLAGKGRTIYYHEVNPAAGSIQLIDKFVANDEFSAISLLPKRMVDFRKCELARFLRVTPSTVQPVSIYVPRKNKHVFHDDVYNGVRSGEPSTTAEEWLNGKDEQYKVVSLRPPNMKSVYELSQEEGGKDRATATAIDKVDAPAVSDMPTLALSTPRDKRGELKQKRPGWLYDSFEQRDARLSAARRTLELFLDENASKPMETLYLRGASANAVVDIETDFSVTSSDGASTMTLRAEDSEQRDSWLIAVLSIATAEQAQSPNASPYGTPNPKADALSGPFSPRGSGKLSLALDKLTTVKGVGGNDDISSSSHHRMATARRLEGELLVTGAPAATPRGIKQSLTSWFVSSGYHAQWAVLRYGVLCFYESEALAKSAPDSPVDSVHLDRVNVVRALISEEEEKSLQSQSTQSNDNDDDDDEEKDMEFLEQATPKLQAAATNAFRIVTPDRILDVGAPDAESCNRWLHQLQREVGCDDEDPRRQMQGIVYEYGGFFDGWQPRYLAVYDNELILLRTRASTHILKRIALPNVANADVVEEYVDGKDTPVGVRISLTSGATLRLRADTPEAAVRWSESLSYLRKYASDVLVQLLPDIDIDDLDKGEVEVESDSDLTEKGLLHEHSLIKKGDQSLFIQLYNDRKRLRLFEAVQSHKTLRSDCVFVLDTGKVLWQWNGKQSARVLRAKGMDLMNRINKKERGGAAKVYWLDEGKPLEQDVPQHAADKFWKLLGGNIADDGSDTDPEKHPSINFVHPSIYAVDADGALRFVHEGQTPHCDVLETSKAYIVDCHIELYVWVGKACSQKQRVRAWLIAKLMRVRRDLDGRERPPRTTLMRQIEGGETMLFKERFVGFPGMLPIQTKPMMAPSKIATKKEQPKIDVSKLLNSPAGCVDNEDDDAPFPTQLSDDVTLKVWRVNDFDRIPLEEENYGRFRSGESYVVLLTFLKKNKECHVIFFYQGRDSSISDKGTSAYLTRFMEAELKGPSVQIRVEQGKEPMDFLALFNQKLLIELGAFDIDRSEARLLYTRGSCAKSVRTVEVKPNCESLSDDGVFTLLKGDEALVWSGGRCYDFENESAKTILAQFYPNHKIDFATPKSKAAHTFFDALDAPPEAADMPAEDLGERYELRLFEVTSASGVVTVDPVPAPLCQDDVGLRNVYIIDGGENVWIHFGLKSLHIEKHAALHVSKAFCEQTKLKPNAWVTEHDHEPLEMRQLFHGWSLTRRGKPLQLGPPIQHKLEEVLNDYERETYSYGELLDAENLPESVDRTNLQNYLTDDEFAEVFGMTREEWDRVPKWRHPDMKKKVGLY